ncbi:MAG: hypothetical protein ACYCU0_03165 [Solirubrobacteraceae bacterium]
MVDAGDRAEFASLLLAATEDDAKPGINERLKVVGKTGDVSVVRYDFAVRLTDHPEPSVHAGWTMRVEQAREAGEALASSAPSA